MKKQKFHNKLAIDEVLKKPFNKFEKILKLLKK